MPIKKFPTTFPTIYDKFQCKGGACRNTCCQKWEITITRAEYNKLRHNISSEKMTDFLKRIPRKEAYDDRYATVNLNEDGYCPYLTENHMCGMQLDYGYNMLPRICKIFPRIYQQMNDNLFTYCLDTGCEATLELLWQEAGNGITFQTQSREPHPNTFLFNLQNHIFFSDYIEDIRNLCIWLLQNRSYTFSDRMIVLGLAIQELQNIQDRQSVEQIPTWFAKWQAHIKGNSLETSLEGLKGNREWFLLNNCKLFYLLHSLSSLQPLLPILEKNISFHIDQDSFSCNPDQYHVLNEQFAENFPNIDDFFENYMILTLFRFVFPFQDASVWNAYLHLCSLYSLLRFTSISAAPVTPNDLIDSLVPMSRVSLNITNLSTLITNHLQIFSSNSLAHMIILLRG